MTEGVEAEAPAAAPATFAVGRAWPAVLAAVAGSVLVGFVPLAARRLYAAGITPFSLLFWRYLLALGAIYGAVAMLRLDWRGALRRGGWRLTLVGAGLGATQTLCFFQSLRTLETGIAVLLFYTYPAVTLVLERMLFGRRVRVLALFCVAMILSGAVPGLEGGTINPIGFLWAIPGPIIYAFYLAANSRLMRRHPPLISAGCLYIGFAASYFAAIGVTGLEWPDTAAAWAALLFIALGAGAASVTLFSYSVPRLGPSSYAIIANCELVTVVLVGVLVLGERLSVPRAIGAALVICGILLHGIFRRPNEHRAGNQGRNS
jgi:drug/metabolite transporter (DMT)-like permease